jgi:adenosylmethionine-8-amino-7-oxononanoate aminotransferase
MDIGPLMLQRTPIAEVKRGIPVLVKGEGVRVYDQEGKAYLDLVGGFTRPVHVGYGRKEIAQAVYDQICTLAYFTPLGFANPPAIELAKVLKELAPGDINHFTFVCDGSEAIEAAIKLARHYHEFNGSPKRYKVISRRGAYHGTTGGALRVHGSVLPMRQIMEPLAPGAIFVESPYCYRCPLHLKYPACDIACARDVERIIQFEDPEQISAFIGEPIQQSFGACAPPDEYWPIIRRICDQYGILIIVDEIICGFGRTGRWFGVEHFDLLPDILAMAKGITSGYVPLGGIGCRDRVFEPIEVFKDIHTYGNHPVSCAAALTNIEILKRENLIARSKELGTYLLERLKTLTNHPAIGEARGTGLWTAIDFTADKQTHAPFPAERLNRIVKRARQKGLIIKSAGSALEFAPPLIIQKDEIEEGIRILETCLLEEEKEMGR